MDISIGIQVGQAGKDGKSFVSISLYPAANNFSTDPVRLFNEYVVMPDFLESPTAEIWTYDVLSMIQDAIEARTQEQQMLPTEKVRVMLEQRKKHLWTR